MSKTLERPMPGQYTGLNYEQAADRAREVCRIAAETGQTMLAYQHLRDLCSIMAAAVDPQPKAADPVSNWKSLSG